MRPFQTVAQILLIASIANSALAAPGAVPKRINEEKQKRLSSDTAKVIKENTVAGFVSGVIGVLGAIGAKWVWSGPPSSLSGNNKYVRSLLPPLSPFFSLPNALTN
jgi:hypothetical protein